MRLVLSQELEIARMISRKVTGEHLPWMDLDLHWIHMGLLARLEMY